MGWWTLALSWDGKVGTLKRPQSVRGLKLQKCGHYMGILPREA